MANPVEVWKSEKHSFDVWPDVESYAASQTPMKEIAAPDLERMKWYGFFYRKRDKPGRFMNRIRLTASELTARQAREIACIADQFGHGIVDITTRANIQVQGLGIEHLPEVARRLSRVGLTSKQSGHDNVRNVFCHPYSGLLGDEIIDTRRLCHDITNLILDSRTYSDLPRKFNVCMNGAENHSVHFWTQDISLLAINSGEQKLGFHLLVGGNQGQSPQLARHVPVLVESSQVVGVVRGLLDIFREYGSREKRNETRFGFLVDNAGVEQIKEWLSGRVPFLLEANDYRPSPSEANSDFVGWFQQRNPDHWIMGLNVPLGRMTWQQLKGLADLSNRWGNGQLRTTPEQGIAVINVPSNLRQGAEIDAAAIGLSVQADPLDINTMACTGSQFCTIAVTETKGYMFQLIERLRKKAFKLHGIRIHMSGCPASCAQHHTVDIGLKGVRVRRADGARDAFDVYLGGGIASDIELGIQYSLGVEVAHLPTLIEEVVGEYYQQHAEGQTFSSYWRERLRSHSVIKADESTYQTPVWICDGCDYEHSGVDPPVFCPGCAGLRRNFARVPCGSTS